MMNDACALKKPWYVVVFLLTLGGVFLFHNSLAQGEASKSNSVFPELSAKAKTIWKTCQGNMSCYRDHLEELVKTVGTEKALVVLEKIVAKDQAVLRDAHQMTHHVGRTSFQHYKDVSKVISECNAGYQSGCYHGALEAFFKSKTYVKPEDVVPICDEKIATQKNRWAYFNCLHGLGHGVTMYLQHDFRTALTFCDTLKTSWDRQSCYGGVFMENVVAGTRPGNQHANHGEKSEQKHGYKTEHDHGDKSAHQHGEKSGHQQANMSSHENGSAKPKLLDPDNLLYPCSDLRKKYWNECYMMQTSIILHFKGHNFTKTFQVCDTAPPSMIPVCYQSIGKEISNYTLRNVKKSNNLCRRRNPKYRDWCYIGVVKNFLNVSGYASKNAFEFCREVPVEGKESCYLGLGEEIINFYGDLKERAKACEQSEDFYIQDCQRGARIPHT